MSLKLRGLQKAVRAIRGVAPELPIQQLQILIEVGLDEGVTTKELEKRCNMTNSSASRNVRGLMKLAGEGRTGLDWVRYEGDPMDLRVKKLFLTDKGRAVLTNDVEKNLGNN